MTADYITKILKSCECLSGFRIAADYLDKENGSVCVTTCSGENASRLYCDGSGIFYKDFELYFRIGGGKDKAEQNRTLFYELSDELCNFGKTHTFPSFQGSGQPSEISIIGDVAVSDDELHSVKYKMTIRLYYYNGC